MEFYMKKTFSLMLFLLGLCFISLGCYDDKLDDPYDTVYNQMLFENKYSSLADASASITGLSAKIDITNNYMAPASLGPTANMVLNVGSSYQDATVSFTNLKHLENNAYYELWVMDNSTTPPQHPISMGKFNIDNVDSTIITYDNPTGLNPLDTNLTTKTFTQQGIPSGMTHSFPIDILNSNSGKNIIILTIEQTNDSDFIPSDAILLKADADAVNLNPSFGISFNTTTGYSTITTEPAGIENGTLNLVFQNLPDISENHFKYEIFAVKGGIYTSGGKFDSDGSLFKILSSDFTSDLTKFDRIDITLEPEPDTSAANSPYTFSTGAIVINSIPNSLISLIPENMPRLENGLHYELWHKKNSIWYSLGKFNIRADNTGFEKNGGGNISSTFNSGMDLTESNEIAVTIEPENDSDTNHSAAIILSCNINNTVQLDMSLPGDFEKASGNVSVGTETGGAVNGSMIVRLNYLPDLSQKGFRYECWLKKESTMTSAGKFDSAGAAKVTTINHNSKQSLLLNDKVIITIEPTADSDAQNHLPIEILSLDLH